MMNIVYNTIKALVNKTKDVDKNMQEKINKYLGELKVIEIQNANFVSPSQQDIILYLIYLLEDQKHNTDKCLDNIKESLCCELNNSFLTALDITNIINNCKLQLN